MRPSTACLVCRSRKQKCEIQASNPTSCVYCVYHSLECSLSSSPRLVSRPKKSSYPTITEAKPSGYIDKSDALFETSELPPSEVCDDLVRVFFSYLHDTHFALFHKPTFLSEYKEGKVPHLILLAICALATRFSSHPYFNDIERGLRAQQWSQAAKRKFHIQAMEPSLVTLQYCLLVGTLAVAEADVATEAICSAIACRITQLMDLPRRLNPNHLERELEIRVFWSIWMTEMWCATGKNIPRALPFDHSWLWPLEESTFEKLDTRQNSRHVNSLDNNHPLRRFSLWGLMVPLTKLKGQIHDLNEQFCGTSYVDDILLLESVSRIAGELEQWSSSLPSHMTDTAENLILFARRGLCRPFIALHIGYHYYCILLYFRFLYVGSEQLASPQTVTYARRCKFHATAISEDLWAGYHNHDSECAWPLVSHLLVVSSSVHLHTLLLEPDQGLVARARTLLQQNYILLMRLKTTWPWLLYSTMRLKAFHEACLRTLKAEDAYRMDDWMMKFLHEHSVPVVNDRSEHEPLLFETLGDLSPQVQPLVQ